MKLVLCAVLVSGVAASSEVQLCTPPIESRGTLPSIGFRTDGSVDAGVLHSALAPWTECPNSATDFPALLSGTGAREVVVSLRPGNSGDARCGAFAGSQIVLYETAASFEGLELPCGGLAQNLAHEIGHVLGLGHLPQSPRCRNGIMANIAMTNLYSRRITRNECIAAGNAWLTPDEYRQALARGWIDDEGWGPTVTELLARLDRERQP